MACGERASIMNTQRRSGSEKLGRHPWHKYSIHCFKAMLQKLPIGMRTRHGHSVFVLYLSCAEQA
jgi:hypothetical protein